MSKRCPNGTRKDKTGKCVPKVAAFNEFNACGEDKEWYIDKCYKKCKPTQQRNPTTRRCQKINTSIPTAVPTPVPTPVPTAVPTPVKTPIQEFNACGEDKEWYIDKCYKKCKPTQQRNPKTRRCQKKDIKVEKYQPILERFINKIKKNIKAQKSIPGEEKKYSKLNVMYLKSMCGDVGICLSLNNNYDKIMKMFNHFKDFKYLENSPKEIAAGANGGIRILKYKRTIGDVSFNSYATLKIPKSNISDNLAYEYYVGHLCVNKLSRHFPLFLQTYGLYFITKETFRNQLISNKTTPIDGTNFQRDLYTFKNPFEDTLDLSFICSSSGNNCLSGQFYNNFTTFHKYITKRPNKKYLAVPFILFQIYYTLHYSRTVFTHYDLHYENVGLVSLPRGYHIEYEYMTSYNNGANHSVIKFKSNYIVKIIDYGRCYFRSQEPPYLDSKELVRNIVTIQNKCTNKLGFKYKSNLNSEVNNQSADLRLLYMINMLYKDKIFVDFPNLKTIISKVLFTQNFTTPEIKLNLRDGVIRNVTDAHDYLSSYLVDNTDNVNGLNDASYVDSTSLGTLKVNSLDSNMEFIPSIRTKKKGDYSRFNDPDIANI
jgi:hypothetical protein